jgi:hypothetical protein
MNDAVLAFHVGLLDDSAFHSDGFAVDAQTERILFVEGHDDLTIAKFVLTLVKEDVAKTK